MLYNIKEKELKNEIYSNYFNIIFNNCDQHKNIYLHAQEPVVDFYHSLGFKKVEDKFHEAGIPHWKMIKDEQKENKF